MVTKKVELTTILSVTGSGNIVYKEWMKFTACLQWFNEDSLSKNIFRLNSSRQALFECHATCWLGKAFTKRWISKNHVTSFWSHLFWHTFKIPCKPYVSNPTKIKRSLHFVINSRNRQYNEKTFVRCSGYLIPMSQSPKQENQKRLKRINWKSLSALN